MHVHIVGPPRSGTTVLLHAMKAGFAFDKAHEEERSLVRGIYRDRGAFLTKRPTDVFYAPSLLRFNPELFILGIVRDPRDVVVSRLGPKDEYWVDLGTWVSILRKLNRMNGHPRFALIRYEDLVRHPDGTQARIGQWLPELIKTGTFESFAEVKAVLPSNVERMHGVRAFSASSINNWKNHKARIVSQIEYFGDPTPHLISLDYETDDSWLEEIKGIEPDCSPAKQSHRSFHFVRDVKRTRRYLRVLLSSLIRGAFRKSR